VRSLPDGVAQILAEYLDDRHSGEKQQADPDAHQPAPGQMALMKFGDLCPECGEAAVVNEEGCRKCYACGYSEC
jgi:ribonucleoside-diphosphate reductase alpha chain